MLNFRKIELSDKEPIQKYTLNSEYQNCDLSFSNLFSWQNIFNTEFAIEEEFLFIRYKNQSKTYYIPPIGKGNINKPINSVLKYNGKIDFMFSSVTEPMKTKISQAFPNTFDYEEQRALSDYVYLSEHLATLKGKKLQAKRNLINQFKKKYAYKVENITSENINQAIEFEKEWCKSNSCQENLSSKNENEAVHKALNNFLNLNLTGIIIKIEEKVVGLSFGMAVNMNTFAVHVEKADKNYIGSYNIINQEFAKIISKKYKYINREEDLGVDGLRKAKLSYQPEYMLTKYTATLAKKNKT